jgi:trigger factor
VYDIVRANQQRGVSKEAIDEKKDEIYTVANTNAKERVKVALMLNRIAEKEGIKVTQEELSRRIVYLAAQNSMKPDKLAKQLQERGGLNELHQQILSAKVLDFLELQAKVQEVTAPVAT